MSEDDLGQNDPEGMRNLRQAKKDAEARAKEVEAELEAMKAENAQRDAQERTSQLQAILSDLGLPDKLARVYPPDGDLEASKVASWASDELGIVPTPQAPTPPEGAVGPWERYDRYLQDQWAEGGGPTELDTLAANATKATMKAVGDIRRSNSFVPTAEEWDDAHSMAAKINEAHKQADRLVRMGKAEPSKGAFGGRLDPPYYANRAQQALDEMR